MRVGPIKLLIISEHKPGNTVRYDGGKISCAAIPLKLKYGAEYNIQMVNAEGQRLCGVLDESIDFYRSHHTDPIGEDNHRTIGNSHGAIFSGFDCTVYQLNGPFRNL